MKRRVLNVGIRASVLGVKFLLIFFLARYLDPTSMGYYGLLLVTLRYSLLLVGLDFYTYTSREILKYPILNRGHILKCQAVLSLYLYLIFIPLLVVLFIKGYIPMRFVFWFFPLLILEHFNQEIYRVLIALSQQVIASSLLFIRHASWAVVVVVVMSVNEQTRNLDFIFIPWIAAGIISSLIGVVSIYKLGMGGWKIKTDWELIKKGSKISSIFLISTFCIVGIRTFDRFLLEYLSGIEVVGAYVLFIGIAGTLFTLMDAGVYSFTYPRLIGLHNDNNKKEFNALIKKLVLISGFICLIYGAILIIMLPIILNWIGSPFYFKYDYLFIWLYVSTVLHVMSMVPHYGLYAKRKDKQIIYSHILGLAVFIVTAALLSGQFPVLAIPFSLCTAFFSILIWKSFAYFCSLNVNN